MKKSVSLKKNVNEQRCHHIARFARFRCSARAKFDICFALHVHLDGNFGTFGLRRSEQNNPMEISQNASKKHITRYGIRYPHSSF